MQMDPVADEDLPQLVVNLLMVIVLYQGQGILVDGGNGVPVVEPWMREGIDSGENFLPEDLALAVLGYCQVLVLVVQTEKKSGILIYSAVGGRLVAIHLETYQYVKDVV